VVGASGSGKSSLVRAGLLPALYSGIMTGAGSNWRIALMRPANAPIGKLAEALTQMGVFGSNEPGNRALQTVITTATLWRGSRGLIEVAQQNAMPAHQNLLVVVDQFEELFRFAREARRANDENYDNEAAAFVKLLLEAVKPNQDGRRAANIFVALTMRSDFLGDCSQFWDLPEAINTSQYLIPRLTRDQLREVIVGPVALGGAEITDRLVNLLLNEIGDDQDQLPVLQHAMMRTWDEWKQKRHDHQAPPGVIDVCCYQKTGGLTDALSNHADEALEELDGHHKEVAEKLFKCLTEKGEDNREIRRPVTLGEIRAVADAGEDEVKTVVETFRRPGRSFLMPPAGTRLNGESLIDISHESLIRIWDELQRWVNEEAESATIYRRLVEAARLRDDNKGELWRGADLQAGLEWKEKNKPTEAWARRYRGAFKEVMGFLDASEAEREKEIREKEEQRRKEAEHRRVVFQKKLYGFFGIVLLALLGIAVWSLWQVKVAEARAKKSDKGNTEAVRMLYESLYDPDNPKETLQRLNKTKDLFEQSGNDYGVGVMLAGIGELHLYSGKALGSENQYPDAQRKLQDALAIIQKTVGTEHVYYARTRYLLALALSIQPEKYAEADRIFKETLKLQQRILGENSNDAADTLSELAQLCERQGDSGAADAENYYKQAENYYKRAAEVRKAANPPDNPQVAADLNKLGRFYYNRQRWNEASERFEQSKKILENRKIALGGKRDLTSLNSVLWSTYSGLAEVYRELGNDNEAEKNQAKVAEIEKIMNSK
jgi:tetratricopeptide (TPR) repeat protein